MTRFFVSYNQADTAWAEWLGHQVEALGHAVVLQAWDFEAGDNFIDGMHQALQECDQMLIVLSRNYLSGTFTHDEWQAAFALRQRIIPFRVDRTDPPGLLAPIIYVDLVDLDEDEARQAVANAIEPPGRPSEPPGFPGST